MARRLSVVISIIALLLLSTAAAPVAARHTPENRNHDTPRGIDTEMRLWLHCGADGADCADDSPRTMTGAKDGDDKEDQIAQAPSTEGEVVYTFSESDLGTGFQFDRTYGPLAEATGRLRFRWAGGWDLTVQLRRTDTGEVLAEDKSVTLEAADTPGGIQEDDRSFDFGDAVELPRGTNLEVRISAESTTVDDGGQIPDGATISLKVEDNDGQSRLTFAGDLLSSQLWTHDTGDDPQSVFPLAAPEEDRRVLATHVLTSAFGADGLSLEDGSLRGRHEGNLIDLRPNGTTIALEHVGGSGPEQIWRTTTSWNFSDDLDPGQYDLEARLASNRDNVIQDETVVTLGAGIDITVRGPATREVRPGENATYRLVVSNQAGEPLEIKLRLAGAGTWATQLSDPTVVVPADGERLVDVKVTPDEATAQDGDEQEISVEADPKQRPKIEPATTTVTTRAVDETRLDPAVEVVREPQGRIAPDGDRTFTVAVSNNGTVRDELFLTRAEVPQGWTASFDSASVGLDPGERRQVEVTVHAARDAEVGSEHEIAVEAQSSGAAGATARANVTMVVGTLVDYEVEVLDRIRTVPNPSLGAIYRIEITSRSNVEIDLRVEQPVCPDCQLEPQTNVLQSSLTLDPGETGESYVVLSREAPGIEFPCQNRVILEITPDRDTAPVKTRSLFLCDEVVEFEDLIVEPRWPRNDDGVLRAKPQTTARPGENVTFPVRVSNVGTINYDSVALDISQTPPGWEASFVRVDEPPGRLDPEEIEKWDDPAIESYSNSTGTEEACGYFCATGALNVSIPANTTAGKNEVVVTATSKTATPAIGSFTYVIEIPPERNVSVRPVERSLEVQPGGDALFNLIVDNEGNVRETVDMDVDVDIPGDWELRPVASSLEIPPSSRQTVTTVLSPPDGASAGQTGEVNITASTAFGATKQFDLTATVVEPADVDLSTSFSGGSVEPGTAIPYDVQVTNQGQGFATVDLSADPVPPGFDVTIQQDDTNISSVDLDAGASTNVTVRIHVPDDAVGLVGTMLRASADGATGTSTLGLNATIRVVQDLQLKVEPSRRVVPAGQAAEYVVTVTNRGTAEDSFTLCIPDLSGACHRSLSSGSWTESVDQVQVAIPARDTRSVLLTVVSDPDTTPGTEHATRVTARSNGDPDVLKTRTVRTETLDRDVGFGDAEGTVGAAPGQAVTAAPVVENRGNDRDVFGIEVVEAPAGWKVDPVDELRIEPGRTSPAPIEVTPDRNAEQGVYGVQVVVFSKLDPTVKAETTSLVRVADFRSRDVDDDGEPEYVVDANGDTSDGFEQFAEIASGGIQTQVIKAGTFGDTVRTGFILRTQLNPVTEHRFWAPDGGIVTNVTSARILGPDSLGFLVDADGDGRVEFMYDQGTDTIVDAVSVRGRDAYLVDGDDDGTMDTYYNHDRGITTTAGDHPGEDVAVDDDGDGSYDLVVNGVTGESHAYTALDAGARAALLYGWLFLLGIAAIVLADVVYLVRVKGGSS